MATKNSFEKFYQDANGYFNSTYQLNITATIGSFNPRPYNLGTMAVVCLMLVHNTLLTNKNKGKLPKILPELNINALPKYPLNDFKDYALFDPYIQYLQKKKEKKKKAPTANELLVEKAKYVATFIRYLFVLQQLNIRIITESN